MDGSCQIEIHRVEKGYVFSVVGRGTLRESPAVRDFICGALDDGADVVMDLCRCEHLDSTFLGCLVILDERSSLEGGTFSVFADEAARDRLFGATHLDRILRFAESLPESTGTSVTLQVTNLERKEFCRHLLAAHQKLADLGGPSAETFQRIVDQLKADLDRLL